MTALLITAALSVVLALSAPRVFVGPTLYDRVLGVTNACMLAALIAASLAVAAARNDWLDVSFGFVAVGFVLNVAVLKFFRARTFQAPLSNAGEAP
jgi:multicomponent Na+:H+ antiporter subunit F